MLSSQMALYRVHFLDHGDNIRATYHIQHEDDEAAIEAAYHLNVLPHINAGFEVWDDDRLVHRRRNQCTDSNGGYRQPAELGEDGINGFGPLEWLGVVVVLLEVMVDGGLKVDDGSENAAPDALAVSLEKKPSTALSQEPDLGIKWKVLLRPR